jgi:peptidoglycan/LPS O-acetylase OafA/YrhL
MEAKMNYRPDIDGLRAIAVLSVLLFHAGVGSLSGGYVGVDVFFVISGFLITTIIVREIEAGEFSIVTFYERRIRRIYPALYVTLALVLLAAFLLYPPEDLKQASETVIAAALFVSNMLFWSQAGYFDKPSTLKPLLHTWSLAVEEQFYIVFPWLVFLLMRFARKWYKAVLGGLAAISFLLSVYSMNTAPSAAFYFFYLRAWELLMGGLLALRVLPALANSTSRNVLSSAGLGMILASVLVYTEATSFPGWAALLPTLGTALVIYSGIDGGAWAGKALSLPPLVFIGKISYSLYLWHWPVVIFGRYYSIRMPTWRDILAWVAASCILASLSWKYVEHPFRSKAFLRRPKIFLFAGGVMALAMGMAGLILFNHGGSRRISSQEHALLSGADPQWTQWLKCNNSAVVSPNSLVVCDIQSTGTSPSFLLWGDSHAIALATAVELSAGKSHSSGRLIARSACPPLLGVERVGQKDCAGYNDAVVQYIEAHPDAETIILGARWALSASGKRFKDVDQPEVTLVDVASPAASGGNAAIVAAGLQRTVKRLTELQRKVVIVLSVPEIRYDVPSAHFIA